MLGFLADTSSSDDPVATVEAMALTVIVTPVLGGTTTVTVTATDPDGLTATQEFEVTVANRPPESLSTLPMLQLQVDEPESVDVSGVFTDPDGDFLTITAASSNTAVATVEERTSAVLVRPVLHGTTTVTVTATDPGGLTATQTFRATVANRPPETFGLSTIPVLRVEDGPHTVDVSGAFTDPDNDDLTFSAFSSDTTVARASAAGAVVTVTPVLHGVTTLTVTATDPGGLSVSESFEVAVANRPPAAVGRLATLSFSAKAGARTVSLSRAFRDPDNDDLTFSAFSSENSVAEVAVADSVLTVTPFRRGTTTVTVTAFDTEGLSATQAFDATVANASPVPVGEQPALTLQVDRGATTVDVDYWFNDTDGDELTYTARSSNEKAATVEAGAAAVIVTPLSGGFTTVTVTATDVGGLSATQAFEVAVPSRSPTHVGDLADVLLQVGGGAEVMDVAAAFEDPDGDALTYTASSSAPAVVRAAVSGSRVTLTPLARGTATIRLAAADLTGSNTWGRHSFAVTVMARPGVTVSTDALTVAEGSTATYTVVLDSEPTGDVVVTAAPEAGVDATVAPPTLTFTTMTWATPQTLTVTGGPDSDAAHDPPLTISHEASGGDYDSVSAASVVVTIVETGTSTLSVVAARASERSGSVMFEVTLSKSNLVEITVDYATSNGSGSGGAQAGLDYTETMGTLTFPANATTAQPIMVAVTNDSEDEEEEETFLLTLTNPQTAELVGGEQMLQVTGTIDDDDVPELEVSFGSPTYAVTEGRAVDVVVRLNRDPERNLAIAVFENRIGASAEDYSYSLLTDRRVNFGPGVTSQQFKLSATDDREDDDGEKLELTFVNLPAFVNSTGDTLVAIIDNDAGGGGPTGPPPGGGGGGGGGTPPPPAEPDPDPDPDPDPGPSGPPKAAFTVDAECPDGLCRALTGVAVSFTDASTGEVRSRTWDFGDGTVSRRANPAHSWAEPGFYDVTLTATAGSEESTVSRTFLVEAAQPAGTCVANATTRCLQDSRYSVTVDWQTADGSEGQGSVVRAGTNDSGLFTFFDANNWEVLSKVLDGCAMNDHVWVFGASTTDLGYAIRVTDTTTGTVKEYRNEPGMPAPAITDSGAFPGGCRQQ